MSEVIEINGEQFVPSKVAAKQVGYTGDYVARLAREGKVDATKVGKTWFVSLRSLQDFSEAAHEQKQVRREELRKERKHEQKGSEAATTRADQVADSGVDDRANVSLTLRQGRMHALAETFVIVLLGASFGLGGYLTSTSDLVPDTHDSEYAFVEHFALAVYETLSPEGVRGYVFERSPDVVSVRSADRSSTTISESAEQRSPVGAGDEIVLRATTTIAKDANATSAMVSALENSFSDDVEVTVDEERPSVAVVFPLFKERRGGSYEFMMVPISHINGQGVVSVDSVFDTSATSSEQRNHETE